MSTTDMIWDFVGSRSSFTLCELADYVRSKEAITDSGILWHVKKLIRQNKLSRLSRGLLHSGLLLNQHILDIDMLECGSPARPESYTGNEF